MSQSKQPKSQFVRLLAANEASIRRYAMSLLADWNAVDDVIQEASVAMYEKFDQFDPERPFVNWACRFTYFEVLKYRKREKRHRHSFSDATLNLLASESTRDEEVIDARRGALTNCLHRLTEEDRELIQLRYATSNTLLEVAEAAGMPVNRMYKQLARIRRRLLSCIQQATERELGTL